MTIRGKTAWAVIVLLALAIGGHAFLAGRWISHGYHDRHMTKMSMSHRMMRHLPDDIAAISEDKIAAYGRQVQPLMEAARTTRARIADTLSAETLDVAKLETDLAALRDNSQAVQVILHSMIADIAADLPPDVREKWRPHFQRPHFQRQFGKRGHMHGKDVK